MMKDGRTTGLMLKAMADASLRPGQFIEFNDHCDLSPESARALRSVMRQMADSLGLDYDIEIAWCCLRPQIIVRWMKGQPETATAGDSTLDRLSRISSAGVDAPTDTAVLASAVLSILKRLDVDSSQKETIDWHSVEESLPEEGEYVLGATQSLVVFTRFEDGKFRFCGVKHWSKLPSVPHS